MKRTSTTMIPHELYITPPWEVYLEAVAKGAFKYYISRFSQILDPPPTLNKQNKHGLKPPTPPKMLI